MGCETGNLTTETTITIAELWHGVERAVEPQKSKRRKYLETVAAALPIIPYTEQTAYEHARIWAELQSAGKMIGAYDHRSGDSVGARQPWSHIQQAAFRARQGASHPRAQVRAPSILSVLETVREIRKQPLEVNPGERSARRRAS